MANGAYGSAFNRALAANINRASQITAIYDEIINRYRPGGAFEATSLQQLEKQKSREVARETQQLISSGLYGTTVTGGLGRKFEEEVGAPARLKLEDIMMQRLSQAQIGKAGFLERIEDVYPDPSMFYGLGQAQATGGRTYGRTFGASSFPSLGAYGTLGQAGAPATGGRGQTVTRESAGLTPKRLPYGVGNRGTQVTTTTPTVAPTTAAPTGGALGSRENPYPSFSVEAQRAGAGTYVKNRQGTLYQVNAQGQYVRVG
jgi:hypothetical protein